MTVRIEEPGDARAIREVHLAAFVRRAEADLVDELRVSRALLLSLVAVEDRRVIGHAAFSEVVIDSPSAGERRGAGLAPMAVLQGRQRGGAGSLLVRDGLRRLRDLGVPFCVVLGHPAYYPRFGFTPASRAGVRWTRAAPDDHFLALELAPPGLAPGVARYRPEIEALV